MISSSLVEDDYTLVFDEGDVLLADPGLHEAQTSEALDLVGEVIGVQGDRMTSVDTVDDFGHLFRAVGAQNNNFNERGAEGLHDGDG